MRKLLIYGFIICELALIISLVKGIQLSIKARSRATNLEEKKAVLVDEQRKLQDHLQYVESDEYVEKVARDELQMGKPGEIVVIVPAGAIPEVSDVRDTASQSEQTNWAKWWGVISGKD